MTMTIVFALVGLLVGGAIGEIGGAFGGAALGYAVGLHVAFKRRLAGLEDEIARLAGESAARAAPPPEPARPWTRPSAPPASRDYFEAAPPPVPLTPEPDAVVPDVPPEPLPPVASPAPDAEAPAEHFRPRGHTPADSAPLAWVRLYFTGGNLVVRTGIIVLFFGVAFLLKFAADRHMLPIELRLAGVALGGAALLVIGWRLR